MSSKQSSTTARRFVVVAAIPDAVFAALTDPEIARKWLAANVEIDARVGGAYRFWGSDVQSPPGEKPSQQIVAYEPNRILTFTWRYFGDSRAVDVTAGFDLEPVENNETKVVAWMTLPLPDDDIATWAAADTLHVLLENLRSYVETGARIVEVDLNQDPDSVVVSVTIEAPASDVWNLITIPEQMDRWVSTKAAVDLRVGGKYDYGWTETIEGEEVSAGPVVIERLEPEKALQFEWRYGNEPVTHCLWELETREGSTLLTVTHSGFGESSKTTGNYVMGWAAFLAAAKALLRGRPAVAKVV